MRRCSNQSWQSGSGRGPTIDISPRRTLKSCGVSSIPVRRKTRPTRVSCELIWFVSAQSFTDRKLRILIVRFLYPYRVLRRKIGPRESSLMAAATTNISGDSSIRHVVATTMSNARFMRPLGLNSGKDIGRDSDTTVIANRTLIL